MDNLFPVIEGGTEFASRPELGFCVVRNENE